MGRTKLISKVEERTFVAQGLEGQDDNFDRLGNYFAELRKTTVETSQPDDLLTFSLCAHFFGVIMLETATFPPIEEETSDEEDEVDLPPTRWELFGQRRELEESLYPATSRATTPPGSTTLSVSSNHTRRRGTADEIPSTNTVPVMSEQEKVLLWREAYMSQLEQDSVEPVNGGTSSRAMDGASPMHPRLSARVFQRDDHEKAYLINWPEDDFDLDGIDVPEDRVREFVLSDISTSPPYEQNGSRRGEPGLHLSLASPPADVPMDPNVQAINESAARLQDELRMRTIRQYERQKARQKARQRRNPSPPPGEPTKRLEPIGLIYLWTSQTYLDPLHMGECSLGLYVIPEHRGKDCLVDAATQVVDLAFTDPDCRRLQSIIVENPDKLYSLELLAGAGFRNEGVRRRAFFSSVACEWKDVTYFAMLATDWVYDKNNTGSAVRLRPKSLWDEVFARHQKECDDLIRLEERSGLKRSSSIETIRERISSAASHATESERGSELMDTSSVVHSSASSSKRRKISAASSQQGASSSGFSVSSALDSDWEVAEPGPSTQMRVVPSVGTSSAEISPTSKKTCGTRSGSSGSSSWSMMSD